MSKATDAPVHLDVQRALEMLGDEPSVQEILRMAEQGLRRDIPHLEQLLRTGEVAEMRQVLHTIKGSLPIYCADPLIEQVRAVEQLCKTAGAPEVAAVFGALEKELTRLAGEIQVHLETSALGTY